MSIYSGIAFTPIVALIECVSLPAFSPVPPVSNMVLIGGDVLATKTSGHFVPASNTYAGIADEEQWAVLKNKIIISTSEFSLGTIIDSIVKTVDIWNSYEKQATLESITESATNQGVTVSGVSVGDVLDGLHGMSATFTIARFGTLTVNTQYDFSFDLQDVLVLFTGTRGIVLIDRPLTSGYAESRAWQTDIFVSENGTEHRAALMDCEIPRRAITFPFKIGRNRSDRYASIENIVTFGLQYAIFIPLWHSLTALTVAPSGTTTVYCDTANCDFDQVDKVVIISASDMSYAVRNISEVGSTSLVLDQSVSGFAVGDFVLPIIAATPDTKNSFEWNLPAASGKMKFVEVDE
jgi:hypothetical protein